MARFAGRVLVLLIKVVRHGANADGGFAAVAPRPLDGLWNLQSPRPRWSDMEGGDPTLRGPRVARSTDGPRFQQHPSG